jgi:hypothetical protein
LGAAAKAALRAEFWIAILCIVATGKSWDEKERAESVLKEFLGTDLI